MNRLILSITLVLAFSRFLAAQQPVHPGIEAYRKGDFKQAVNILSLAVKDKTFKTDPAMWNYLGLAYISTDDFKKARKALEKAVDLGPTNATYHSNLAYLYLLLRSTNQAQSEAKKAIALNPKDVTAYFTQGSARIWEGKFDDAQTDADQITSINAKDPEGYLLGSRIQLARLNRALLKDEDTDAIRDNIGFLKAAIDILDKGAEQCKDGPRLKMITDETASIRPFYEHFSKPKPISDPTSVPDPSITPFKVTEKPRAAYTDSARQNNVSGAVRIAVLLGASGKVEGVLLFKRLGYGLDQSAIEAARRIKFEPKMKDGKPISSVVIVEYNFNIY